MPRADEVADDAPDIDWRTPLPRGPAELYARLHRGNPGDLDFYRRACAGASSVLELGCGHGRVLRAIATPETHLVGVDLDPELLALARRGCAWASPRRGRARSTAPERWRRAARTWW